MGAKLDGNRGRRAVRDMIDDIDYVHRLSEADREWLEVFVSATAGCDRDAQAALSETPAKFKRLRKQMSLADHASRRDLMALGTRAPYIEDADLEDDSPTLSVVSDIRSEFFQYYRCTRCMAKPAACTCPIKQRNKPYGVEDYTQTEENEDTMLSAIETKRRLEAYDMLPYGNPEGLRMGCPVQICLPRHYFKNAYGVIVETRDDGKWLVEVTSRKGLKDRDGDVPERITIWVAPEGLRRAKPRLV